MAEKQEQKDQTRDTSSRERGVRTVETTERAAEQTTQAMRLGGQTVRRGMHHAGETMGRGVEAAGEVARRGFESVGEGAREVSKAGAGRFDELTESFAEAVKQSSEDLATLMRLPGFGGGVEQWQHAVTSLVSRVVEANVRATQDVVRATNPGVLFGIQHRVVQHYLHGLIEGSAEVFRVSRHLAEDALRPIEERARTMQRRSYDQRRRVEGHKIAEVMSRDVEIARPDQSVQEVAKKMAEIDAGVLPVGENDRLIGMVTDRDIAFRVTAEGKDPRQTRVREIMTEGVRYCFEDEDVDEVAENMAEQQVRRLPVVSRNKRLVGVVSLGDIATSQPHATSGAALQGVSRGAGGWGSEEQQRAYGGDRPRQYGEQPE